MTVFEQAGLTRLSDYDPVENMEIFVTPVQAQFVKVTVDSGNSASACCIDEFEIYGHAPEVRGNLPQVAFRNLRNPGQPVRRTSLAASLKPVRIEGDQEVMDLEVNNTGEMTALFCEPHPLIEYRTDLFIENNNCFIPPGESRTITIRSACNPKGGLTLVQTGWRISTWNADDQVIEPGDDVELALGRRDAMTREYLGYTDITKISHAGELTLSGRRPDPSKLPLLQGGGVTRFEFKIDSQQAKRPALLRVHTADQWSGTNAAIEVNVNGTVYEQILAKGLGIQNTDPAHLAFPATVVFEIPSNIMKSGKNVLEVRVRNDGWFTWDAMEVTAR